MTIQAEQPSFPALIRHIGNKVIISIQCVNYGDYFQAEVAGGWWVARGVTKKQAVSNLIKRIEKETNYEMS